MSRKNRAVRAISTVVAIIGVMKGASVARATLIAAPSLPGGATNLFAGGYSLGGDIGVNSPGAWPGNPSYGLTDGYIYDTSQDPSSTTTANTNSGSAAYPALLNIFAAGNNIQNAGGQTEPVTTTASFNTIRIYAEVASVDPTGSSTFDAYNTPPLNIAFAYGFTSGNPENPGGLGDMTHWGATVGPSSFGGSSNQAGVTYGTIVAINGTSTGASGTSTGALVSLTEADWLANGVVPGTAGANGAGVYYIDLTVANSTDTGPIPITNALEFDFGADPGSADAGNGGFLINEVQAYTAAVPEPTSLGLLVLGGVGLLTRRRRSTPATK